MSTVTRCPNCSKSLTGILSANLISQTQTDLINLQLGKNAGGYCSSCVGEPLNSAVFSAAKQTTALETELKQKIQSIPLITSPAHIKWDYEVLGMVTAQTTAGTGFMTELSRSFNDFFGSGSNATNRKVAAATTFCQADLRIQAVRLGGNAIISTDIDFNEIGAGSTNMLMVCMAGTAIQIKNLDELGADRKTAIEQAMKLTGQLEAIAKVSYGLSFVSYP